MKQANIIGKHYYHVFANGDVVLAFECTEEEYLALGLPGAGKPAPEGSDGLTWLYSFGDHKYDSVDGFLDKDSFAIEPTGRIVMKDLDGYEFNIDSSWFDSKKKDIKANRKQDLQDLKSEKIALRSKGKGVDDL